MQLVALFDMSGFNHSSQMFCLSSEGELQQCNGSDPGPLASKQLINNQSAVWNAPISWPILRQLWYDTCVQCCAYSYWCNSGTPSAHHIALQWVNMSSPSIVNKYTLYLRILNLNNTYIRFVFLVVCQFGSLILLQRHTDWSPHPWINNSQMIASFSSSTNSQSNCQTPAWYPSLHAWLESGSPSNATVKLGNVLIL